MNADNIQWPYSSDAFTTLVGKNSISPPPHVSGTWENITVSEALDRILRIFPGIWIYENCLAHGNKKRIVYIRFYQLKETPYGSIVQ
jgi:hypothetical protein